MPKPLSERIRANAKPRRRNRAAFLAVRVEIQQALDDGWSKKAIWETLFAEKVIAFGYDSFLNYLKKSVPTTSMKQPSAKARASTSPTNLARGFEYSPTPNKEELF